MVLFPPYKASCKQDSHQNDRDHNAGKNFGTSPVVVCERRHKSERNGEQRGGWHLRKYSKVHIPGFAGSEEELPYIERDAEQV